MPAYELLAYCRHLTLCGIEDGELQWMGTAGQWTDADIEQVDFLVNNDCV